MKILKERIFVIPEDKANFQIANGFQKNINLVSNIIQIMPLAKGGDKAINEFVTNYAPRILKYPDKVKVCLLIRHLS